MISIIPYVIFFLFINSAFSQDMELAEFSREALNKEKTSDDEKNEFYRKRAIDYLNKTLKKELFFSVNHEAGENSARRRRDLSLFNQCTDKLTSNLGSGDLKKYLDIFNTCNDKFKVMSRTDMENLRRLGIRSAIDFENTLAKEEVETARRRLEHDKKSHIEKKIEYYRFDAIEIPPQEKDLIGLDGVFKAISDFTSVTIEFNREKNLNGVIQYNEGLEDELKRELTFLNYLVYRLSGDADPCENDREIVKLSSHDKNAHSILSDFKGLNENDYSVASPMQIFLGVDEKRFRDDVDKYYFELDEGKKLYMFKHEIPGTQNETWVLAEIDPKNNSVRYSHYELIKSRPEKRLERTSDGDITIIGIKNFHRRLLSTPSHDMFLDMNVGLSLDANKETLPFLGRTSLPTGVVDLAYAKLSSHAPGLWTETKAALQMQRVKLSSILRPNRRSNWGVSAELSYYTFDNKWKSSGSVRVHNLLVGVTSDLKDEVKIQAGIYKGGSFIIYESNIDSQKLKLGTALPGNKGGVYADTDFKKFHNVTVFINLN